MIRPLAPRRHRLLVALATLAVAGGAAVASAAAAPAVPVDHTYDLVISPGLARHQNETFSYSLTCWDTAPNTGVTADLIVEVPEPTQTPFSLSVLTSAPVGIDGGLAGQFQLPPGAPQASYSVYLRCHAADGSPLGGGSSSFLLFLGPDPEEERVPTTTTTSAPPLNRMPSSGPIRPVAAEPIRTHPAFTG
jgi:hypothetical protein